MGQNDALGAAGGHPGGKSRRIFVGQVPLASQDPLLQGIGVRPGPQAVHVVVALQHQQAHPRQNLLRLRGHIAGVRQNANGAGAVDAVIHALGGVVGRGKGRDPAGADAEFGSGVPGPQQRLHPRQAIRQLPGGAGTCVQGDGMVLDQGGQAGDMVRVLVGNQNAVQLVHGQLQLGQTRFDAAGGYSGVHQDMGAAVGQQQAVALGAAGQGM